MSDPSIRIVPPRVSSQEARTLDTCVYIKPPRVCSHDNLVLRVLKNRTLSSDKRSELAHNI